jgi:putative holliday junction resolvase
MSRILAIDYGRKRTGLAWTDIFRMIAHPIGTVETKDLITHLQKDVVEGPVNVIVIGHPRRLNLEDSHVTRDVEALRNRLRKLFPDIEIVLYDERLTSKMAHQTLIDSGVSKSRRREKELINTVSAVIILQDYLQYIS